jgi:hypothetical protein
MFFARYPSLDPAITGRRPPSRPSGAATLDIPDQATLREAQVRATSPSDSARRMLRAWTRSDPQAESDHTTGALTW